MSAMKSLPFALAIAFAMFVAPAMAGDKPHLGFSTAVAVTGAANPTIGKLTVSGVTKGSPADVAGLKQGDEIIEVNGKPAVGSPAADLAASIKGTPSGAHLRFKVKRSNGAIATVDIIAG